MIEIYNSAGVLQCSFPSVLSASLCDKLSGERTLSFSVLASRSQPLSVGMTAKLDGQFYNIVRVSKRITGGLPVAAVQCEHITYALNDEKYNLETFVFSGTPTAGMTRLLSGTPFSVGVIEATGRVECNVGGQGSLSRRNVLMRFIGTCGCEVEYDGYKINLRKHRGSTDRKSLMDGENVTDLAVTMDSREDTQSYTLSLFKMADLQAGDEVNITYTPMGVNVDTRIVGIEYNPFCRYTARVEVGTYVPGILDNLQSASEKADAALKTAQDTAESLSEYAKKSDVSASIDTYINSEAGQASIVASLSGTYATTEDLTGYALKTELSAEIGAYIDTQAGTAKIVNNLSGTFVKSDALGDFVEKTELATEIGSYIDTQAGTAKIISAASGTFQKKSDMGSYVTTTTLNTSVAQYIDSATGKAKIISACSGTYVTGSDLAGYAKASALTSIEQSVSDVEAAITLSSSYSKSTIGTNVYALLQLVSNANSSSIKIKADKIDFTGFTTFVKASDLGAGGTTSIDGGRITTGKISADRIEAISVHADAVYGTGTYSSRKLLTTSGLYLYVGGETASAAATYTYIMAQNQIVIGTSTAGIVKLYITDKSFTPTNAGGAKLGSTTYPWGGTYIGAGSSTSYYWKLENACLTPSSTTTTSSSTYFNIGSSTYPVTAIYTKKLYLNGTEFTGSGSSGGGGDFAGSLVKMGGSASYYVQATTSRQLCPNTASTTYAFYLGTSSYYWHYAYLGSVSASIGSSASSKLGFFGTTPAARQTVADTATVATLISALKKYGLIY